MTNLIRETKETGEGHVQINGGRDGGRPRRPGNTKDCQTPPEVRRGPGTNSPSEPPKEPPADAQMLRFRPEQ